MGDSADVPRPDDAAPERSFTLIGPEKPPAYRQFHEDPALTAWRVGQLRSKRSAGKKATAWDAVPMLPVR